MQKKVALLGAPGVGKTSLVRRVVDSVFDDRYLPTIGVKVDKKTVSAGGRDVTLMLWDVAGAEERFAVPASYVRGASGLLLVADGTRPGTLDEAFEILAQIAGEVGPLPYVLVLNKADLAGQWAIDDAAVAVRAAAALGVRRASARTGDGVEEAFAGLAAALVA